ncbi:unnamed protein product [Meganyctiphanes norvegica]|uniref:Cytochrome P450 n=1 Tax=Meganyctiphanes norvegica TaxID=48144 RepID=A0AAV2QR05_MEGNR
MAVVTDAETVKHICIKDFDHFVDRRPTAVSGGKDVYTNEFLTAAEGSHWKGIRSVLSPTFSSGKMKHMFPMIMRKANELNAKLCQETSKEKTIFDMNHYCGRFTVDVVASCAFGFEINAINEDNVEFVDKLAEASKFDMLFFLKFIIAPIFPTLVNTFDLSVWKPFRYHKQILEKSIQTRKETEQLGVYGDFLDLILEAQAATNKTNEKLSREVISEDTVIASSVIFLIAGFNTVKDNLVILLHLLAANPTEQQTLRKEIQDIIEENGSLNYQSVMEAKFLEACVSEMQRIVPTNGGPIERKCTKNYIIPGTKKSIEKNILVQIPIWSLHHDERYWSDPSTFNPENFMSPNKQNIVTGSFLPFGLGPRNCIAQRFALMEVKIMVARLVQQFQLSLAPGREELKLKKGPIMSLDDTMPIVLTPLVEE